MPHDVRTAVIQDLHMIHDVAMLLIELLQAVGSHRDTGNPV